MSEECDKCKVRFGRYFCEKCRLFDDTDKGQYHCDDCGICRWVGMIRKWLVDGNNDKQVGGWVWYGGWVGLLSRWVGIIHVSRWVGGYHKQVGVNRWMGRYIYHK